jgi:hypothetical protein
MSALLMTSEKANNKIFFMFFKRYGLYKNSYLYEKGNLYFSEISFPLSHRGWKWTNVLTTAY